ncbi:uncharacterized protein LOC135671388 isoform X2 [Musa acuminata AAA Group]
MEINKNVLTSEGGLDEAEDDNEEMIFVGFIGNLVHSSPNIKKEVLHAGDLQPVIDLLRTHTTKLVLSTMAVWCLFLNFLTRKIDVYNIMLHLLFMVLQRMRLLILVIVVRKMSLILSR